MALLKQTMAIVIIGVTGSGKSTFINVASGSNFPVRESLGSGTTELKSTTFSLDGQNVVLIDTPGFDDGTLSVLEVLKLVSDHFSGLCTQGVKLAGVIYMHCITEDHMRGPSTHNFLTFSKFCGDTSLRDVLIVTNQPPEKQPNFKDGKARGQQSAYKDEFFGPAIENGARMLCHDGSRASARAILRRLLRQGHTDPPAQGDSSGQKVDFICTTTSAGTVRESTGQVEHYTKASGELCQGIDAETQAEDEKTNKVLQEEARSSLEEMERIPHDLEEMITNFATENSLLEEENRRYKDNSAAQKVEAEFRTWLPEEERRSRELAEAKQQRAEAQLAEERALWECEERKVTNFSTENSRLEEINRRNKDGSMAQKEEAELRIRLLEEELRAREVAEAKRERAEAQLDAERALWERQKTERESSREHVEPTFDKLFACGALIFILLCVSRFAFDSSPSL